MLSSVGKLVNWVEANWRVPRTKDNGMSRQKVVSWCLVIIGISWAIATSYYATRVRTLETRLTSLEREI